ncbi:MAG: insulinase family protein [Deltaproteobacteria bacterium]|nr:insulinase family protein [Deltaproteobacteria bacterium]
MIRATLTSFILAFFVALVSLQCGASRVQPETEARRPSEPTKERRPYTAADKKNRSEQPPASGAAKDIAFPPIIRSQTINALEVNTVELHDWPLVDIQLIVKSGLAADPEKLPGLSKLVAAMLKEGTTRRSSATLAEAIDFLGARLSIRSDQENIYIKMSAMSEHLAQAMALVAEIAMRPLFSPNELGKLKKRELNRLALQSQNPDFLAVREFFRVLYGDHPYAHIDTTPAVVKKVTREQLETWHKIHFAPNNAFLVVAGDVSSAAVLASANRYFKGWAKRNPREPEYHTPPTREDREVVVVDRPQSVQSVIYLGNLALERKNSDYLPLLVANEVLGGSATSRLFSDLRERRGLTYGTYSHVSEKVEISPFSLYAAVRNEVTKDAMDALMAHLDRIVKEPVPIDELADTKRYLIDSFPLKIDTSNKIAEMVADLRIFGLPDDYWDSFRTQIDRVTQEQALKAAATYIRPQRVVIVVVGKALAIKDALSAYGSVTIVDTDGNIIPQTKRAD